MEYIIALLVAVLAGMVTYQIKPLPASYFASRVDAAYMRGENETLPFYRGVLAAFGPLLKYTPVGWVKAVGQQLYWCQLTGKWTGWTVTEILALHIAVAIGGGVAALLFSGKADVMPLLMAFALAFLLNIVYLRSPARRVRRQLASELPEFVSILAAEVASETTLQEAVGRVSRGSGVCAAWFRQAQRGAVGKSLFAEGGQAGALFIEARETGDRDLIMLARTLDNIKRRGTGMKELLSQVARDTASRFIGEAQLRAEKVGSEIILPMIFFFFMPYIAVILAVMAAPLASGIF